MSLTSCLKKAGPALSGTDKAAILASASAYRKEGLSANEAAIKAVDDVLAKVQTKIAGIVREQLQRQKVEQVKEKPATSGVGADTAMEAMRGKRAQKPDDLTRLFTRGITPEQRTDNFKRWSNDAPLVTSAQAMNYAFKSGEKVVLEAFHGSKRPDRIGTVFKRNRATSGPMAFFTSAPELASSYATNKSDTSLANEDQQYATWFKYKPQGERTGVDIDRAWYRLPEETKAQIAALAPRVTTTDDGEQIILGEEGETRGNGGYYVEETRTSYDRRGNPLKALVTAWLDSGSLYDQETKFLEVLKLAGFPVKDVTFDSPFAEYPSVYKAFVFMQSPLVTSDIPQEVKTALERAALRDRSKADSGGADMWAKNTRTLREWVQNFNDPANESNSYVWTSIPDKVTDVFKSLGYDGIIDWSGKGGGHQHPVYIPFEETQVKSATGNKGTFDREKKDILRTESQGRPFTEYRKLKGQHGIDFAKNDAEKILGFKSPVPVMKKADQALADRRVPMYYDLDEKVIVYNTAFKDRSRAEDAQWMAEEILHAMDHASGKNTISLSSDKLKPGGDLRIEVEQAVSRSGALKNFLQYPLEEDISEDRKTVELFARLGVVFKGFPELLQATAPKTYEVYRAIFAPDVQREVRQSDAAADQQNDQRLSDVGRGGQTDGRSGGVGQADPQLGDVPGRIASALQGSVTGVAGDFGGSTLETRATSDEGAEPANPPELSPWRDGTGRLQFAPGAWLYDKLGDLASPLLVKVGLKAANKALVRQMRAMKLTVQAAQEKAAAVAAETNKLSEEERSMVSDLIEQEMKAGTVPPAHAVRLAALINENMGAQTDELVRLGMLTKDSAEMWRGKYLPRYYKSKLGKQVTDAWADALGRMLGRQKVMAGIKGKHLKGRGLYETIPVDQLEDYKELGWEVRDPEYSPTATDVQVWRDFTREERDKMGEIRDAGFRFVMGYMQTQRDIALGRMFEGLSNDPDMASKREDKTFTVQVPDGTVPGTGAKRYGMLAGKWVSKETMSHLSQIEESQSEAWQMYRKALGIWKEGKTALNPVSHVNNMVSNLTMAHLAGVSYHRADKYFAAAKDFATKAPGIREAKEAGLFLGTMSDAELMNVLPEDLKALVRQQDSTATKIGRTGFNMMTFWLRRPMGAAYQAEDTFFRYLIYKDARDRGMEAPDAVDHAQKFIFTYDDLPKGARMIRDFGIPFFSYTYKAAPALLHTALTHPVRMAAPAAVLWGINAAAYAIATGDDEDSWDESLKRYFTDAEYREKARTKEKLEREHLPSWNKGTTALMTPKMIRLGMDELTKLPLFIDVSRIIPGGDLFDVSPNAGGVPLPQPLTPSHPILTTVVAMIGNKDMFRGKDLVDSNDTRGEASEKRLEWLWTQLTPAIAAGNYHWERGMNAIAQANGGEVKWMPDALGGDATGVGKDGLPTQAKWAAAQTFGIKIRPMDLDTAEKIDASLKNKMLRDIDLEVNKLKRLNSKGAVSDRVFEKARDDAREKKDRIKSGLTVDGDAKN